MFVTLAISEFAIAASSCRRSMTHSVAVAQVNVGVHGADTLEMVQRYETQHIGNDEDLDGDDHIWAEEH